ncbi:MAG: putative Ig domain-containing protein, partial [Candidatus Contendobacter sp.]|nr:putative Ig domain-containing protein [Candidatus Contendobacter sp.]
VQMQLVDDNFSPLAGVLVTVGDGVAPAGGVFSVAFSPAEGKFGKTDDKGALAATVNFTGAGAFSIPFKVLNGTATYTLKFNVPAPTDKADDDGATTTDPLTISTTTLAGATTGTFYTALLQAAGGKTPYAWSLLSGVLPGGISLNSSTGVLSGTPSAPGTFNFVVQVKDSAGATALANFALVVTQPGGGGGSSVTPSSLILLVNSPDLPSSGQQPAELTAIARDGTGVLLKDVSVQFKVKSTETDGVTPNGTIQVITSVTDESGVATASLSTGGNKRNRTITVGASSGAVNANDLVINVTGTTLNVSGASSGTSVLLGNTVKLIFNLNDSSGAGIPGAKLNVSSVLNGLAIPPATSNAQGSSLIVTTNTSGVAEVNLTVNQNGQDTVNATWEGNASSAVTTTLPLTLSASPDTVVITVKDNITGVADVVGIAPSFGNVEVTWLKNGAPVVGATINLNTTKGTLSLTQGITDAQGKLTGITIQSIVPGGSVITATGTKGADTVTTQKTIQFGATTPSQLTLQANPNTIAVNVPPSTSNQSTIVATVRDVNDNPVPNQTVTFAVIQDTSGGTLTAATAKTDFSGQASVVYIAGSSPTKENGVAIRASIALPGASCVLPPNDPPNPPLANTLCQGVNLTVSKREVFITLGTGNTIEEPDPTTYALPYNVLVNDIVGGAVQGATVTLNTVPSQYRKGQYVWNGVVWVPVVAVSCANEDVNSNGILDPGEDINTNGRLDPGNVVTPSVAAITTDADGFGKFDVLYAQQYANWINNVLTARTKVGGSEDEESAIFILPPSAADVGNEKVSPPGQPSPFGVLPSCQVSVEQEAGLTLTTVPPTELSIAVGGASLFPLASAPPGSLTVTVNLPGFAGDLTGTTIAAQANSIVSNARITVPSSLPTTGSTAVFSVTVSNTSNTTSIPVSAAGTSVGTVSFVVGNAKVVVAIKLTQN